MRSNKNWEAIHKKRVLFQVKVSKTAFRVVFMFFMNELCELLFLPVVHLADPITQFSEFLKTLVEPPWAISIKTSLSRRPMSRQRS